MSERTTYKNQWRRDNEDTKLLTMPKGKKAEIQAAADEVGEKLNAFILRAIDERIKALKGK